MSYPDRGPWGDKNFRGNVSGYVIRDLISNYFPTSPPKQFIEVFSGGGTGQDVCQDLKLENTLHLDLSTGWDALTDKLPAPSDLTFSHPPYWDIIKYNQLRKGEFQANDLSNKMPYLEFINKLDCINEKIYLNLLNNGYHAILIGDIRRKGKYYSPIKDMAWFGNLKDHFIKIQHNTKMENHAYNKNSDYTRILHEHLLVFQKKELWNIPLKYVHNTNLEMKKLKRVSWQDLIITFLQQRNTGVKFEEIINFTRTIANTDNLEEIEMMIGKELKSEIFIEQKGLWFLTSK
jgi:hypothetical protein